MRYRDTCGKCGARRIDSQIGLEPTPEAYVAEIVAVFREIWRVLRKDGTVWLNLGDSYAGSWGNQGRKEERGTQRPINGPMLQNFEPYPSRSNTGSWVNGHDTLKPKDLIGIPWRVAFALQADGWYLRSDIIYSKPNPMPESVTDRPTKSHEYVFMLTKAATYYYDSDAIREESIYGYRINPNNSARPDRKAKSSGMWRSVGTATEEIYRGGDYTDHSYDESWRRNRRSVWEVASEPFSGAHFATFPRKLIEPMILAGTSEKGCCPKCRTPWVRVVSKTSSGQRFGEPRTSVGILRNDLEKHAGRIGESETETIDWRPGCACNAGDPVPCIVFDPFCGSGTTQLVAKELGRIGIGLDLKYQDLAAERITGGPLLSKLINAEPLTLFHKKS
jgi:DNA modification methylase